MAMAEGAGAPVTQGEPGRNPDDRGSVSSSATKMQRPPTFEGLNGLNLPAPSRPLLVSQQSCSLPSTPMPHVRELAPDYRTTSPSANNGPVPDVTSPRSARSESDGTLRLPGRSPFVPSCPYETSMAYSRRRMPYSLGEEKLEPSLSEVPQHLEPAVQKRLDEDITKLYEDILPSPEDDTRRARFVAKLEKILNERWPEGNVKVHVFGSSGNLLATKDSDGPSAWRSKR